MFKFVLFLLGNLFSYSVFAGGFSNLDIGFKRCSMFAVVANLDDASAIYHNSASMINIKGTHLNFANTLFMVDLTMKMYDSQYNLVPKDHSIKPTIMLGASPYLGFVSDLGTKKFRIGVAFYVPNAYGAFLPDDEPTKYHMISGYFVSGFSTISFAYQITKKLYVGAGISIIGILLHGNRIMNLAVSQNPDLRFYPEEGQEKGDMDITEDSKGLSWGYNFGLILKPIETFRIGMSFTSSSKADMGGDISIKTYSGDILKTGFSTRMVIPFTLRFGVSWEFIHGWEIAADINYWHYQVLQTNVIKLDKEIVPGMKELSDPKNYGNSVNIAAGLKYAIKEGLDFMLGYQIDFSPIPANTLSVDSPTRDMFGIACGVRWQATKKFRTGIAYVKNWYKLINTTNSITDPPLNAKGFGSNNEVIFELDYKF